MFEASYTAKLLFVAGADSQLDHIGFELQTPAESRSWGAVKALYGD